MLMAYARIDHRDLHVDAIERDVPRRAIAQVDAQRLALATETAHELIHEADVRADELIL